VDIFLKNSRKPENKKEVALIWIIDLTTNIAMCSIVSNYHVVKFLL